VAELFLVRSMASLRRFTGLAVLLSLTSITALASEQLTPAEKNFFKAFADHVERIWYANMEAHEKKLVPGTVCVRFAISTKGRLMDTRVLSNTSNDLAAQLSLDAIRRAKIPPAPQKSRGSRPYSSDWKFTIYVKKT
jgi:Gram-negative bacterial TonB protein C-terminal